MITLHHLNNSRSQRILWLLEELGVEYELVSHQRDVVTNLAPPELLKVHPLGKSPVLEVDGAGGGRRIISESGAIVKWLCNQSGSHMIPEVGTNSYIDHTELMHFAEGSAMTPILLGLYVGRLGEAGAPLGPRIEEQLQSHFLYMENLIRPSGHFVLDDLSACDVMLSFPAEVAIKQGRGNTLPKLAAFAEMIHSRPAFKKSLDKGGPYRFA